MEENPKPVPNGATCRVHDGSLWVFSKIKSDDGEGDVFLRYNIADQEWDEHVLNFRVGPRGTTLAPS